MKKMILSVALCLATFGVAQANIVKNTNDFKVKEEKIESLEQVIILNDSTPHIKSFYDVERIVIENKNNVRVRIYNSNWVLILDTTNDVNISVIPGDYHVACEKEVKTKYICRK